ncbi:ADP-ribosyltransferase [Mycobacterium heckeshornense]|uniref:ADP-ribosyltransferase n=1 Tax=Mycobacterium heckeshornense TaxID=110505 RepID=UPI0023DFC654|nr:ADP-ribosyltransferase [Mycobacterium heckeshornense]
MITVGEGLAAAVGALTTGYGANTGQDAAGEVFGLEYQSAAESTLQAAAAAINACRTVGFKVRLGASNYSKAEAASTLGGGADVLPPPAQPSEFAAPGAPGTLGPGVPEPLLWSVVESFVGDLWPNGNAAQIHAAAGCWRTFGAALHGAKDALAGPNSVVGAQQMPESGLIQQAVSKLGDDVAAIGAECDKLAKSLDDFANQVQQTQDAIRDLLHRLGSVSGLFHEVVEVFKGHGLDEVKKIANDIKAVLRNLMRESQAREQELSQGMQTLDGLVQGLQIYMRGEIIHFVGEDVGNPLATAFDVDTNVGEGLVKDVFGVPQGIQALNPLRFGYDPKGAAATWKGLAEMVALGDPMTAPVVDALDPQARPNLAKGLLHTEDWRADRPGLGAGENLGDLLMLGIPGAGEAGAAARGTEAAGAAARTAEEADAAAAAAGRGGRALGEAGELGRATGALGDISKTSDALTKDLQNVGGNLPKTDPPAGGRPLPPPGPGEPPVGPTPRPGEPAPVPRAEPPTATRPQEPAPATPRGAEPPSGPHEPATVGEPPAPGGTHEPVPAPAGQHSAPAAAVPAEQLPAPAHVESPPQTPITSETSPGQPTLAGAQTPQSAPPGLAPHLQMTSSSPGESSPHASPSAPVECAPHSPVAAPAGGGPPSEPPSPLGPTPGGHPSEPPSHDPGGPNQHGSGSGDHQHPGVDDHPPIETDTLTPDDRSALADYTGTGYAELNSALRSDTVDAAQQARIDALNRALEKLPTYDGPVVRGTNLPPEVLARYQPGEVVTESAFTSTTTNPAVALSPAFAGNVEFRILSSTGRDVSSFSMFPDEQEILFPPGTNFYVVNRTVDPVTGRTIIEMIER